MKKTKIIIPALGMLLLSTAASITGTVAWFSMNTTVTATGMQVQAKAQAGLVISNASNGTYDASATTVKTTCAQLLPGSTADFATWLTSVSTNPGSANTQQAYTAGVAWTANNVDAHYVLHDFYIRSSSATALTVASLNVNSVTATRIPQQGESEQEPVALSNLSKALRVGVNFENSSNHYIYAPISGAITSYTVQNAAGAYDANARTSVTALSGSTVSSDTSKTQIPGNTANGLHAYVYIWFEGEDANCISNNIIANLDEIAVDVVFGFTAAA